MIYYMSRHTRITYTPLVLPKSCAIVQIDPDGKTEEEGLHEELLHDLNNCNKLDAEGESGSRSASTHKRRKRGARKGKGSVSTAMSPTTPSNVHDVTLETLAQASQALAREISRTSRQPVPMSPAPDVPPLQYPISPGMALPPLSLVNASVPTPLISQPRLILCSRAG